MKTSTKKEIRAWIILSALQLAWIVPCGYAYTHQEPVEEVHIEETETEIIQWKQEVVVEEVEVVAKPQKEEVQFYNVPLSEELQLHIFKECEKYNIAPALIVALIDAESDFDANALSPYGDKGLMQINPKWHSYRMERLNCTDLYDPFQNITVGIDYIAELKAKKPDVYWVLMAYNQGMSKATERIKNEKQRLV